MPNLKFAIMLLAASCAASSNALAATYDYLDDTNVQPDAPVSWKQTFPKVANTETKSFDATAEQFSKYDLIGTKSGEITHVEDIQQIDPNVRFHFGFSPRAYQGYNLPNPCSLAQGMTFETTGPATEDCQIYAGHWLYFAGTRLAKPATASANIIFVNDGSRLKNGQYVVIYDSPPGSFKNAEHAKVTSVDRSVQPNKVVLASRGYKSQAAPRSTGAIIAQHALGRGGGNNLNWSFNQVKNGPLDSKNRTIGEAMVEWLDDNVGRFPGGAPSIADVHGIYFDADPYRNVVKATQLDGNNDLVPDRLLSGSENLWGEGMHEFYAKVAQRFPNLLVVGGMRNTRGLDSLNGVQMEGWPVYAGDYERNPPNYGHSNGKDGYDSMFQRYIIHTQFHKTAVGHTENLSRVASKLYPNHFRNVASNAPFRLGFATTLLGDGFYIEENSSKYPDRWYDEYAVNVTPRSANYGRAVASNPNNEANIRNNKNWLGRALGPYTRIYNSNAFAANKSKLSNGSFEGGSGGWTFQSAVTAVDNSVAYKGNKSLKLVRHSSYKPDVAGVKMNGPTAQITAGKEYTLSFAARAQSVREVMVQMEGSGSRGTYLVPQRWVRVIHTFKATKSGTFRPQFLVGAEDVVMWLDDVYLFEGNANVFMREFENGIVAVNGTPSARTVNLGGTFLRIKGTGQDPINNGAAVSSVTIAPYDAAILVRRDGEQVDAGGGSGGGGTGGGSGGGGSGGGGTGDCGAPALNSADPMTLFAWKDTCNGQWRVRVISNSGWQTFDGDITVDGSLSGLKGVSLESHDTLTQNGSTIDFVLKLGDGATDGFNFSSTSGDVCLDVNGSNPVTVRLGANAQVVTTPVNLVTGGACGTGGGGSDGGGSDGGGGGTSECGAPELASSDATTLFAWKDTCTGQQKIRVLSNSGWKTFDGEIAVSGGFSGLQRVSLESHDTLAQNGSTIDFVLKLGTGVSDGFNFTTTSGNICLDLNGSSPATVRIGANAQAVSLPVNLATGGACGQSISPYGKPDYINSTQVATYLWQNQATGRWSLRVHAGGSNQTKTFTGRVYKATISQLQGVSLEASDDVTQTSSTNVTYSLRATGKWDDGFNFNAAPGACVQFNGTGLLGASKTPVSSPLNLTTLGACN